MHLLLKEALQEEQGVLLVPEFVGEDLIEVQCNEGPEKDAENLNPKSCADVVIVKSLSKG